MNAELNCFFENIDKAEVCANAIKHKYRDRVNISTRIRHGHSGRDFMSGIYPFMPPMSVMNDGIGNIEEGFGFGFITNTENIYEGIRSDVGGNVNLRITADPSIIEDIRIIVYNNGGSGVTINY